MKGVIHSNFIVFIAVYTLFPWSCVRTGTEEVGLILTLTVVVAEDCATDTVFVMVSKTVVSNVDDVVIIGDWKKQNYVNIHFHYAMSVINSCYVHNSVLNFHNKEIK